MDACQDRNHPRRRRLCLLPSTGSGGVNTRHPRRVSPSIMLQHVATDTRRQNSWPNSGGVDPRPNVPALPPGCGQPGEQPGCPASPRRGDSRFCSGPPRVPVQRSAEELRSNFCQPNRLVNYPPTSVALIPWRVTSRLRPNLTTLGPRREFGRKLLVWPPLTKAATAML